MKGCQLKMNEQFNYILNEINTNTILRTDTKNMFTILLLLESMSVMVPGVWPITLQNIDLKKQ